MTRFNDLTGQQFGFIEVLEPSHLDAHRKMHFCALCHACSKTFTVRGSSLTRKPGKDKKGKFRAPSGSCGCLAKLAFSAFIERLASRIPSPIAIQVWGARQNGASQTEVINKFRLEQFVGFQYVQYVVPVVVRTQHEQFAAITEWTRKGLDMMLQFIKRVADEKEDIWGNYRPRQGEFTKDERKFADEINIAERILLNSEKIALSKKHFLIKGLETAKRIHEMKQETIRTGKRLQMQFAKQAMAERDRQIEIADLKRMREGYYDDIIAENSQLYPVEEVAWEALELPG